MLERMSWAGQLCIAAVDRSNAQPLLLLHVRWLEPFDLAATPETKCHALLIWLKNEGDHDLREHNKIICTLQARTVAAVCWSRSATPYKE